MTYLGAPFNTRPTGLCFNKFYVAITCSLIFRSLALIVIVHTVLRLVISDLVCAIGEIRACIFQFVFVMTSSLFTMVSLLFGSLATSLFTTV